jgi:hypothetical protein
VEQRDAELALQIGDRLGQRGLRDVEVLRRPAETVVIDDGEEVLELQRVHGRVHPR